MQMNGIIGKPDFCELHTSAQLISAFVFTSQLKNSSSTYIQNFKLLAFFCDCTDQFVSHLVGNLEDRFSCVVAQIEAGLRLTTTAGTFEPPRGKTNNVVFEPV